VRWTDFYQTLAAWGSPLERLSGMASAQTLAVARFETVFWENTAIALLDLTFAERARTAVLPGVAIDTVKLAQNEGTACFWAPAVIAALGDARLDELEAAVTPWLRTLVRGRATSGESIRRYQPCEAFEAARDRGDLGAAPLGRVLAGVAPFAFARRFASGARVDIRSTHAARGAAVLRSLATEIAFADDPAGSAWFGITTHALSRGADLAIVESFADVPADVPDVIVRTVTGATPPPWRRIAIPEPVPMDWPLTFDETDAPATGYFAVCAAAREPHARRNAERPRAATGSSGRIALLLRADAYVADDADVDEARELATLLQSIGIDARLFIDDREVSAFRPDLVHVFAGHGEPAWYGAAARLRAFAVPYVVSLEPLAEYALWEERAMSFLSNVVDGDQRERFRSFFVRRSLTLPPGEPDVAPSADYVRRSDAETGELLRGAAAVLVAGDGDRIRERFALPASLAVREAGTLLAPEPEDGEARAFVPNRPFAFAHGPVVPRNHVLSLIDALRGSDVPLVIAGPISDVLYGARIARAALDGVITIADATGGELAALYRRATLFIDPSLRPAGTARVARAALCGAFPLVPARSPLARLVPYVATYDSVDRRTIRAVVETALSDPAAARAAAGSVAAAVAPRTDLVRTFAAILEEYARSTAPAVT
jgi:hypothetical protein